MDTGPPRSRSPAPVLRSASPGRGRESRRSRSPARGGVASSGVKVGFFKKLTARVRVADSLLCVGLDPHESELEEKTADCAVRFCAKLIEETKEVACSYKPNAAFFEVFGSEGVTALKRVLTLVPPDIPVILDAKRGDIGSTSEAYAKAALVDFGCDAVTVSPYLGGDGLEPFLRDPAKAAFVLCKTSNPGSRDLQELELASGGPLYIHVAKLCCGSWARHGNAGLVVGATDVVGLRALRAAVPDAWFLSPGVGAQGGDLSAALDAGLRADGLGVLVAISRGISKAASPKAAAEAFRVDINERRAAKVAAHAA